jgi:ABC-2 type transport system ATP-binding protein/ribosome-dependent ATPase
MSEPLLAVNGLVKSFGANRAVDDVSLQVEPGEVVGLLGANGAGKTTVIRMLLGLLRPDQGDAHLFGSPPSLESRRRLGYVPQGLGLYQELTVAENVAFSAQAYDTTPAPLTGALADVADRLVSDVPLGLQRRAAFVCALQHHPQALVLDEPTSGVDPLARARLWDTVREQADEGVGVLVTTHYMQEARQCDRLVLMSRGRVVGRGSERDIVGDTVAVLVHTDQWQRAFQTLDAAGVPVTLAGRDVRAIGIEASDGAEHRARGGLEAEVERVPATIDERMTVLAREPVAS